MLQFGFAQVHHVARNSSNVTTPIEVALRCPRIPVNFDGIYIGK